jgi:hypothetical protein
VIVFRFDPACQASQRAALQYQSVAVASERARSILRRASGLCQTNGDSLLQTATGEECLRQGPNRRRKGRRADGQEVKRCYVARRPGKRTINSKMAVPGRRARESRNEASRATRITHMAMHGPLEQQASPGRGRAWRTAGRRIGE